MSWPVTGGADFDLNMPMIVPMYYDGPEPIQFLEGNATPELLDRYYPKYWKYLTGPERSLDHYTMALATEILRDYEQPDVMLVKLCDLDTVRHATGVDNEHTRAELAGHDAQVGAIVDLVGEHGDLARTNFVVIGDHGQSDIAGHLNLNVLFRRDGLLQVDEAGDVADYVAFAHSSELTAWVQLADPVDEGARNRVAAYLADLAADPRYGIGGVYSADEIAARFCSPARGTSSSKGCDRRRSVPTGSATIRSPPTSTRARSPPPRTAAYRSGIRRRSSSSAPGCAPAPPLITARSSTPLRPLPRLPASTSTTSTAASSPS